MLASDSEPAPPLASAVCNALCDADESIAKASTAPRLMAPLSVEKPKLARPTSLIIRVQPELLGSNADSEQLA